MLLEPLIDDSGSVAWGIILLVKAMTSREPSCHEWVHLVLNNVQITDTCQGLCYLG